MLTIPAVIGVADYFLSLYSEKTSIEIKTMRINNMFSFVILIGIPSMYILFLKGDLIVSILFERGSFTSNSTQMVNIALVPLSFMIIPLLVQKAIDQIFQVENKVSIVLIRTLLGLFLNIILNYIFVFKLNLGLFGVSLATTISYWFVLLLSIFQLINWV